MKTETFNRAVSFTGGRQSQPETQRDIHSSDILKLQSYMGNFSDSEIENSIRRTREQHKEIIFKPRNFGQ